MSIPLPRGFRFAGVAAGIKRDASKEDVTLIVADEPAVAAGVYTTNLVFAAPVEVDRGRTPMDNFRVLVANSGNANACTGSRGRDDALAMASQAAAAVGASASQALVMSTGIIGHFLPMQKIAAGIEAAKSRLGNDATAFLAAARGICTTDKSHKIAWREFALSDRRIRIAGMCKGAGMIGPRMATMLCAITTDAKFTPATAQAALRAAVEDSFNCISVEGHMSTNDTVLLLASGAAGGESLAGSDLETFQAALLEVCTDLAKQIPDDGEGAKHLITIDVEGCASREDARRIAKTIGDSNLVKAGIAGADPNWGRIVSAAGYAGVPFNPSGLQLWLNGTLLYENAAPVAFDASQVSQSMREHRDVHVRVRLAEGTAAARFWASDLTVDYVRFNADYST